MKNEDSEYEFEGVVNRCGGMILGPTPGIIVRHKESGLEVKCTTERSQHRNRAKAITIIEEILTLYEFHRERLFGLGDLAALKELEEEFKAKYPEIKTMLEDGLKFLEDCKQEKERQK